MIMTCRVAVVMVFVVAACTEPPNVTILPTDPAWRAGAFGGRVGGALVGGRQGLVHEAAPGWVGSSPEYIPKPNRRNKL